MNLEELKCTCPPPKKCRLHSCPCGCDMSMVDDKYYESHSQCNHEPLEVTIHGKCGHCGKQLNITAVDHEKDESCCKVKVAQ